MATPSREKPKEEEEEKLILSTRVSTFSQTLIDHIITNVSDKNLIPELICSDISDHFPTFVITFNTTKANNNKPIFRRNMKKFNSEKFKEDVFKTLSLFYNCSKLITTDNFDSLFANFISNFKTVIDKHAPIKKLSQKQIKLLSKPWITKGILVSIHNKQKMYVTHFKNGDIKQKTFSKNYSNKLNKSKIKSIKMHYEKNITENQESSYEIWKCIRCVINNKNNNVNFPKFIIDNYKTINSSIKLLMFSTSIFLTLVKILLLRAIIL